ncbi:hypothetical protein [Lentzea flaviverrucosa]|uniref:Uncharacterized protein n=1 Tax=Lentzea flaviverrucosa TaxID=200379 RepID=A0A1H9XQ01_9PSEU|nr:hypothetical protein [Lentzea flaviverrucosa]RDI19668.1 hypothetical protein DFR72_11622 [Lentzea flaviverrucosa]SES47763.1 hypothetical protein SAMN05216195_11622 [Lentzea flaviverrucosa]
MTREMKARPISHVPDAELYRETFAVKSAAWGHATCARCGHSSHGRSVAHIRPSDLWVCSGCHKRARERRTHLSVFDLKAAGLEAPEAVFGDAVRDDVEWSMDSSGNLVRSVCTLCDTFAGPVWGGHRIEGGWLCRWCAGGPSGWGVE